MTDINTDYEDWCQDTNVQEELLEIWFETEEPEAPEEAYITLDEYFLVVEVEQ